MGSSSAKELGKHNHSAVGTPEFYDHVSTHAYRGAAERQMNSVTGGFTGGFTDSSGHFIGADELDTATVRDYVNSANSHTKTQIIEDLIAVGTNLGLKVVGATPQEKIKSMSDLLNTSKQINPNDETHQKLCRAIALAVNKAHGNEIIDVKMPPGVVCQQVAEIISSLSAGMHTEFLAVYADVRKVLKNLHVLKDALKDDHTTIMLRVKESDDQLLPQQLTALTDLHDMLTKEIERQIDMLSNLLNVTLTPTEKALSELIKNKKSLHGYIEKINVKVGSENFSKVIADILKGLGITANFALLIERALKTVGMTLDDYAKGESIQKLREKITQGVMGKNLSDEQLHEYLQAAELLYRNFYRNQDIANSLKAGGDEMFATGISGGDDVYPKSFMDKRIADRKKVRDLIFNTFHRQINGLFDQLVGSIDSISMKIGTEIPLSEQLSSFRHILQRIDEGLIRNKNIYYAMIGYYNDAMSKSKKDSFVADLNMISSYIDTLLEMPIYSAAKQHFTAVQGYIKAISTLIDQYSDEIAAKFGRGEDADPACMYLEKKEEIDGVDGAYESADAIYGGDEQSIADEPKIIYRSTKSIHDAIRQFDYKYRVAQIRSNMKATGKELKHYSEKYEKITANSIADILSDDKKIYDKLRKQLTDDSLYGNDEQYRVDNVAGFDTKEAVAAERENARKMLDYQWEVKKKFWATVEAVDTYMKVFTDALVNNPDDIQDIKSMISSIEVIGDWYSEKTGNDLAGVFDHFPSMMQASHGKRGLTTDKSKAVTRREVVYPPTHYSEGIGSHYYKKLHTQLIDTPIDGVEYIDYKDIARSAMPGNPYLVTLPSYGEQAKLQAKKTLNGLSVLKNLLSVFINVGAKFAGEEIRKKIFMTPTQMYANLIDYLNASAFAQGFGIGDFRATTENELPNGFYSSEDMSVGINMRTGICDHSSNSAGDGSTKWRTTYEPGSPVIHLGVTADSAVSVLDYQYAKSTIAPALVGKINNASTTALTVLGATGPQHADMKKQYQSWESTSKPEDRVLLFKKRWGVWMRSTIEGLQQKEGFSFIREDEYFVLVMKSLAAKILTVVGMYDVLDRPMEFNGLSAIRMITGGSNETPKVDAEAVALYLRLPLLAEFYRGIFGFEGEQDPNNEWQEYKTNDWRTDAKNKMMKVSMVPDIDGTFASLIRLIFRKNKFLSGSNYADEDLKELIREINLVYQRMQSKYPQNTVMETINEFVAEINRRYGVVSENERNQYEQEFGQRYNYSDISTDRLHPVDRYDQAPETDIAILPGEGDDEIERKSAAQKLLGETFDSPAEKKRLFTVNKQHKDLIYRFRCAIDKYFEDPDEQYTFNHAIKSTQLKLKNEQNDEARFKLVSSLVRGVDVYSKVDGMKYILFHETVVGGLNLLSAMHSMLARFKRRLHCIDLRTLENQIWEFFSADGVKTIDKLVEHSAESLISRFGIADAGDVQVFTLLENTFGLNEAHVARGGHNADNTKKYILRAGNGIDGTNSLIGRGSGNTFGIVSDSDVSKYKNYYDQDVGHHVFTCNQGNMVHTPHTDAGNNYPGGLASVLAGFSVEQLREARKMPEPVPAKYRKAREAADTFMRFIFDREYIMKELLETLFGFSHDFQGLVEIKVEDGKLFLSWGGLKTMIEDMFQHISYFIDLLRPHIKSELMMRYTNKFTPGSFYWLQEQIMEKIIVGRKTQLNALPGEEKRIGYVSIDELMQGVSYTYQQLTRQWNIDGSELADAGTQSKAHSATPNRNNFDKVFAEMIFYDGSKPGSGIAISNEAQAVSGDYAAADGLKIVDYMHDPYESLHFSGPAGAKQLDTRYAARFYQLYSWKDEFTFNRSTLFAFNQLIAKYIKAFYDPVAGKIYAGTLNQFANGAFSRSIADQTFTYPDTTPLWFVKYAGGTDMKLPNSFQLMNSIPAADQSTSDNLIKLLEQYVKIGIAPGDHNNPTRRSGLLKADHPALAGRIDMPTSTAAPISMPKMYVYLLIHAIGAVIAEVFEKHNNGVVIDKNAIRLCALNTPGVTDMAAAAGLYGAQQPNIINVMDKLLEGDINAILQKIHAVAGDHDNNLEIPHGVSNLGIIISPGAFGIVNNMKSIAYVNLFRSLLKFPDLNGGPVGTVCIQASTLFPQHDDALRTQAEITNYVKMYAAILIRLRNTFQAGLPDAANRDKIYEKAKKEILADVTGVKSTYAGPLVSQPKHLVKQDDLYAVNDKYWNAQDIYSPSGDANYLLLARKEDVQSALEEDNITKLPGNIGTVSAASSSIGAIQQFGKRFDPDSDHVLFTSLSVILKNLMQSRSDKTQALVYILDNVADIPLYMKEKMRASLPAFRNLFKELSTRCEFLKKFIGQSNMSLAREFIAGQAPVHNPWPYVLSAPQPDSELTKRRFVGILDTVIRGCNIMVTSCEQVLREVGDDPKYFELYQHSIKEYKSQYGVDPLMPLSSCLAVLQNTIVDNETMLFPGHALGQEQFKFNYGTRSLLGQPNAQPLPEHIAGFTNIIDGFNLITDSKLQADKTRADAFMKTFVKMIRYVNELKNIKGILTPHILTPSDKKRYINSTSRDVLLTDGMFTRDDLVVSKAKWGDAVAASAPEHVFGIHGTRIKGLDVMTGPIILTNRADLSIVDDGRNSTRKSMYEMSNKYAKPVFSLAKSLTDTIRLTESSFKEEKIKELVEYLCKEGKGRHSLAIQNIIDLGIVPINVHALMREIPLVNLYNYAYTFDRLIIELYYGLQNENARKLISELCSDAPGLKRITSAKDMLVALLIDPYMNLFDDNADTNRIGEKTTAYDKFAKTMLAGGANNGELGRPKFLSDQLYNKAVFGQLYANREEYNEMGPAAASTRTGQITEELGVAAISNVVARVIHHLNEKDARFIGTILVANANKKDFNNLCKAVVKYVAMNPAVNGDALVQLILNKFFTKHYPAFLGLRAAKTDEASSQLAIFTALITKLVYLPMALLVNGINNGVADENVFLTIRDILLASLHSLNTLGLNDIGGGTNGDYLGIDKDGKINTHKTPLNREEASDQMLLAASKDPSYKSIRDADIKKLTKKYDTKEKLISYIITRSIITLKFGYDRKNKNLGARLIDVINVDTLRDTLSSIIIPQKANRFGSERMVSHQLHWLDTTNDDYNDNYGVGKQILPRGDNDNVIDNKQVQQVDVSDIRDVLADIGRLRFDTIFIRNLIFIVNLYRSIRMKLQRDLVYSRDIILKAEPITRVQLTEFYGNQVDAGTQRQNYVNYQKSPLWKHHNY